MLTSKLLLLEIVKSLLYVYADVPMTPDNICAANPPSRKAHQLSPPFSTCKNETKHSLARKHPDQNKKTVNASFLHLKINHSNFIEKNQNVCFSNFSLRFF